MDAVEESQSAMERTGWNTEAPLRIMVGTDSHPESTPLCIRVRRSTSHSNWNVVSDSPATTRTISHHRVVSTFCRSPSRRYSNRRHLSHCYRRLVPTPSPEWTFRSRTNSTAQRNIRRLHPNSLSVGDRSSLSHEDVHRSIFSVQRPSSRVLRSK
jgi:hypothetical protein